MATAGGRASSSLEAQPPLSAVRRRRVRMARCAAMGRLWAAYARIDELEHELTLERLASVRPAEDIELRSRMEYITPVVQAGLDGAGVSHHQQVMRNVASHLFDQPIAELACKTPRELNTLQRGSRGGAGGQERQGDHRGDGLRGPVGLEVPGFAAWLPARFIVVFMVVMEYGYRIYLSGSFNKIGMRFRKFTQFTLDSIYGCFSYTGVVRLRRGIYVGGSAWGDPGAVACYPCG